LRCFRVVEVEIPLEIGCFALLENFFQTDIDVKVLSSSNICLVRKHQLMFELIAAQFYLAVEHACWQRAGALAREETGLRTLFAC
jgi:hypothetical protein